MLVSWRGSTQLTAVCLLFHWSHGEGVHTVQYSTVHCSSVRILGSCKSKTNKKLPFIVLNMPISHIVAEFKPTIYINITNKIVFALNGIIFKLFPIYSHTEQHIPVQSRAGVLCLLKLWVPHGTWSSPLNSKSVLSLVAWLQNYMMPRHCGLWVNSSVHCVQCLEKPFLNSRINDFLTKHSLVQ